MKAKIVITPKKAVVDPQGKTVQSALEHMGYQGVGAVHVGKYLLPSVHGSDREAARRQGNDRQAERDESLEVSTDETVIDHELGKIRLRGRQSRCDGRQGDHRQQ